MRQPDPIDTQYVLDNFIIDDEIRTIKASTNIGSIAVPHIFSFATTCGGHVPLSTITQEASELAITIKRSVKDLVEAKLGRAISANEMRKNVNVSVGGGSNTLHVCLIVARQETQEECASRLVQRARMKRIKRERIDKNDVHTKAEQAEYAVFVKLSRKFVYDVDSLLKQAATNEVDDGSKAVS